MLGVGSKGLQGWVESYLKSLKKQILTLSKNSVFKNMKKMNCLKYLCYKLSSTFYKVTTLIVTLLDSLEGYYFSIWAYSVAILFEQICSNWKKFIQLNWNVPNSNYLKVYVEVAQCPTEELPLKNLDIIQNEIFPMMDCLKCKLAGLWVNFIKVLWAVFTFPNPQSPKMTVKLSVFCAFWICAVKDALERWWNWPHV